MTLSIPSTHNPQPNQILTTVVCSHNPYRSGAASRNLSRIGGTSIWLIVVLHMPVGIAVRIVVVIVVTAVVGFAVEAAVAFAVTAAEGVIEYRVDLGIVDSEQLVVLAVPMAVGVMFAVFAQLSVVDIGVSRCSWGGWAVSK